MCRGLPSTAKEVEVKVMGDKEEQKEAKQAQPSIRALCKRARRPLTAYTANSTRLLPPSHAPRFPRADRYATTKDACTLSVGSLAVLVSGCNQPLQLVVFGRLMDSFNLTDRSAVRDQVYFFAGMYALLGLQQLVTVSQDSCVAVWNFFEVE